MKAGTFAETLERVKAHRSRREYALLLPLLTRTLKLPSTTDIFDPDNIELALMLLPEDAWSNMNSPQTIQREDGTWQTGDVFFDELEDALARGESLEHVISRLNTT